MVKNYQLPSAIKQFFTLKGIKTGFGHDLAGAHADIIWKGKNVGYYDDDGWGGESVINIDNNSRNEIEEILKVEKFNEHMFANGWEFMESPDKIEMHSQIEAIIEQVMAEIQRSKDNGKGIMLETPNGYTIAGFKGCRTLKAMVDKYGKGQVEAYVMKLKVEKRKILNVEELAKYGIQV
jgi:hypothetical protein